MLTSRVNVLANLVHQEVDHDLKRACSKPPEVGEWKIQIYKDASMDATNDLIYV